MGRKISFRGLIESEETVRLSLSTNNGKTGYKIRKFDLFPHKPGTQDAEDVMKLFKTQPDTTDSTLPGLGIVDFSNNRLIAAAFLTAGASIAYSTSQVVVFDNEKFNQDLYLTYVDSNSNDKFANYYIELESMDLSLDEATVATLKDIRNTRSS
jgi:hypothetical protein